MVWFLVFGVLNAKNLAFSTFDASALINQLIYVCIKKMANPIHLQASKHLKCSQGEKTKWEIYSLGPIAPPKPNNSLVRN